MARWEITPPAGEQQGRWTISAPDDNDPFGAFLSGAADTASFGFGDELMGVFGGEEATRRSRLRQARLRASNPVSFGVGQIGGAFAGGGALGAAGRAALGGARALQGVNWLGRAGINAAAGGVGLSAYGAGSAGDGDRLRGARDNFLPGALLGGGFSLAGSALGPVVSRIWTGARPERAAADLMARGFQREGGQGVIEQRLGEHAAMGRGGTLLDAMDESGGQLAMGAANRPSAGRVAMRDMLEARNQAMGPRAQQEISREFGGGDVADDLVRLEARRAADSQPHYAAAYGQTVAPSQVAGMRQMVRLDRSLAQEDQILTRAAAAARSAHIQRTGDVSVTQQALEASPRYWHDMLEAAQDTLGMQLRAARTGAMGGLSGSSAARATERVARFNRHVRQALGADFRRAQDIYAGASRTMRAQELGYDLVGTNYNSLRLGEAMREIRRMSQGEVEQLRMAAASKLRDMIANADPVTGRADVLRAITRSEGQRRLFDRIFGAGRLTELMRRFAYDRQLFQQGVNTGIRTNSHTAPILSAERSVQESTLTPATTQGSWFERIFGPELRRAADQRNEQVSNELLSMLSMPADDALRALRTGGQLGTRGGLLRRAAERARQQAEFRQRRALAGMTGGLYSGIGGDALVDYAVGERF